MDPRSTFAIVVGVEKYDAGAASNLPGPAHDAERFTRWLIDNQVPATNIQVFISPLEEVTFPCGVVVSHEATRNRINEVLRDTLAQRREELFILFWGGHGVIQADHTHRLFYADATNNDKKNLDLMDLMVALRSNYYNEASLKYQILIVDACSIFAERMRWDIQMPDDNFPLGSPVGGREQIVLFAAQPGGSAANVNAEKTGLFSRELLDILRNDRDWPPSFKRIIEQLDDRFKDLYQRKKANQTPSYYWFIAGNAFVREFSIPELLLKEMIDRSSERLADNQQPRPQPRKLDFDGDIRLWAENNGLDVEDIKAQLIKWVTQLERTAAQNPSKLALVEFYKKNFSYAGDLSLKPQTKMLQGCTTLRADRSA